MKKQITQLQRIIVACILPAIMLVSCSIDDKYDMSKELDMTVGVGKGFAVPVGSTEKIMLTELIDTTETDVIKIDAQG